MNIYLTRHGKTDCNINRIIQGRTDTSLNNIGIEDSIKIGKFLKNKNIPFEVIFTSPLKRAYKTAQLINNELNNKVKIIKDDRLIERYFGPLENEPYENNVNTNKFIYGDAEVEKIEEVKNRTKDFLSYLTKLNYENVLIVSHSHTIKSLLMNIDNNISIMDSINNSSLSLIRYENEKLELIYMNEAIYDKDIKR